MESIPNLDLHHVVQETIGKIEAFQKDSNEPIINKYKVVQD